MSSARGDPFGRTRALFGDLAPSAHSWFPHACRGERLPCLAVVGHDPALRVGVHRRRGLHPGLTLAGARGAEVVPRDAVHALRRAGDGLAALDFSEDINSKLSETSII